MTTSSDRIFSLLRQIYPEDQAQAAYQRIMHILENVRLPQSQPRDLFSEQDITLITYGDSLLKHDEAPLKTLHHFVDQRLKDSVSTVHILPFYPYSSDDGFSVIDYYAVNPSLGTWEDVTSISENFRMMFDAVINHMSVGSAWFQHFLEDHPDDQHLFFTAPPDADLSSVTRPRTTPVLTPFIKANGETVHVWTTFSDDQADLDYSEPNTLIRILEVLLFYVQQGAQVIRLDAIAYMWKEIGTTCIHLPQTHTIIQLYRAALDVVAPQAILITETNVPHAENISYFGDGNNEAQMVYNFTLPPLLFHTLLTGDASKLSAWINTLDTPSARTTFFNFTASHDGIGVRPVEGILTAEELAHMIAHVEKQQGRVSYKNNPDGTRSPYELNITYLDAVTSTDDSPEVQVKKFILSQAVMLTLAGVPAIYIHSLLGSHNDLAGMQRTGHNRTINRAKLDIDTVNTLLDDPTSQRAQIFSAYTHLIRTRIQHSAFHPKAEQQAAALNNGEVLTIRRTASDETILAVFNVSPHEHTLNLAPGTHFDVTNMETLTGNDVKLSPYQVRWLKIPS